jgi:ubiquinone/menaquinone biosynthesis C-methylase UbiE
MNPWSNPDALAPDEAKALASFIDARAATADQAAAHTALVAALAPQPGARLLDVGCGTGVIARRLAEAVQPGGVVVGVDISRAMLDFAEGQTLPPGLRYEQANAASLPFPDAAFDGAAAARTLMHVDDPQAVLMEVQRVLGRGGRFALLEADWGTLALDHSDHNLTRRIIDWRTDFVDGNNWMGRQLARRCSEAGWQVTDIQVLVTVARDERTTLPGSVMRCAELARQAGVIAEDERQRWLEEIGQRLRTGQFFATMNEYIVVATRR